MKREVCFLIGEDDKILYADTSDNPAAITDQRSRWEMIWNLRDQLQEIAHSHPLGGLHFSHEDETTMQALDAALGRALRYSVIAPEGMIIREFGENRMATTEPWWAHLLRLASGIDNTKEKT